MGDIVNLNKARKAKAKSEAKATAVEHRARFGASRNDKAPSQLEQQKITKTLDGAKLEPE